MTEKTKDQIQAENADLLAQLDALRMQQTASAELITAQRQQLQEKSKELEQLRASGSGWLIETNNSLYDGKPWGVQFTNGQAFLKDGDEYPQFAVAPMEGQQLQRYLEMYYPWQPGMDEGLVRAERERERLALIERTKTNPAEIGARRFHDQLGYRAEYYSPDRQRELQERTQVRLKAAKLEAAAEAQRRANETLGSAGRGG